MKQKVIRAVYDEETITVYQAYNAGIAAAAVQHQTFAPPFKKDRMTWIKPSFLWMMYRAGWGTKENQERILAVKITRLGFHQALENACLSHYEPTMHDSYDDWRRSLKNSPVRLQWDPEKDIHLQPLSYKSIQIGLSGIAVDQYVNNWIVGITDITDHCTKIYNLLNADQKEVAESLLPVERFYNLPDNIANAIHSDQNEETL